MKKLAKLALPALAALALGYALGYHHGAANLDAYQAELDDAYGLDVHELEGGAN